jgi:phosphohistidine phosphatase SixA
VRADFYMFIPLRLLVSCVAVLLAFFHTGTLASPLADKLASGDYVLLMRHAYAPGVGDPPGYSLDRCETQRNLDEQGQRQAERAGQWLRQQGIAQATVLSSVWCRCRHTAERLGYGPVTIEPSLASFFDTPARAEPQNQAMQRMLANMVSRANRKPLILVTHHVNILQYVGENIGSGDMVLARVGAQGQVLEYARIPSP